MDTTPEPGTRVAIEVGDSEDADYWRGKQGTIRANGYTPPEADVPLGNPGDDRGIGRLNFDVWIEVDGMEDDLGRYPGIYAFRLSEIEPIEEASGE